MSMDLPAAPKSHGKVIPKLYPEDKILEEAERLINAIKQPERWTLEHCKTIAAYTLEINELKKEKDVYLIAHSYQTPDIIYGVADEVSDSYSLSKSARDAEQQIILFSSVRFMAETAKILSPNKLVIHPSPNAGCSLSESITAKDVRELKRKYPGVPVACYINTTAEVKAEVDVCVTSSNYLKFVKIYQEMN